jgi:hypothetical protein
MVHRYRIPTQFPIRFIRMYILTWELIYQEICFHQSGPRWEKTRNTKNKTKTTLEMSIRTISRKYLPKVKCSIDHARSVAGPGATDSTVGETRKHVDKLRKEIVGKIWMELKVVVELLGLQSQTFCQFTIFLVTLEESGTSIFERTLFRKI